MGWAELKSGPFEDSEPVPYLAFSGLPYAFTRINAGPLLDFFNHNYPAIEAFNEVHADVVRTALEAAGMPQDQIQGQMESIMAMTE